MVSKDRSSFQQAQIASYQATQASDTHSVVVVSVHPLPYPVLSWKRCPVTVCPMLDAWHQTYHTVPVWLSLKNLLKI